MSPRKGGAQRTRVHLRCPCCGRLAAVLPGDTLPAAFRSDHTLDAQVQAFTGKGRGAGFAWSSRELSDEEQLTLTEVISAVADRLRGSEGTIDEIGRLRAENEKLRVVAKDLAQQLSKLARNAPK